MKIGMIGTGSMGGALGTALAGAGHEVVMGSRDPQKAVEVAKEIGAARGGSYAEAAADAEVVFLGVPWLAAEETLAALGDLSGKILVDITNPYGPEGLIEMGDTSNSEEIQKLAPAARVVKGWNSVYARNVTRPSYDGLAASVFICGDDQEAKDVVMTLAGEIGFDPVDVGPLAQSRNLTKLLQLQGAFRWGPNSQLRLLRR